MFQLQFNTTLRNSCSLAYEYLLLSSMVQGKEANDPKRGWEVTTEEVPARNLSHTSVHVVRRSAHGLKDVREGTVTLLSGVLCSPDRVSAGSDPLDPDQ